MQQPPSQGVGGTGDPYASNTPNTKTDSSSNNPSGQSGAGGSGTANELKADVQQLGSKAASRLHSEVDARKGSAASQARTVSSALQRTVGELDQDAPEWLKSTFRQGAEQIQRFADSIEQKDSRQLMRDVEGFARERPGMFLAACAAAGFAAARIFKAGGEQSGQRGFNAPQAPYVEPAYGSPDDNMSTPATGELV